jgi:hypothetical protein
VTTPLATAVCHNCGAADLGTSFCETCGTQMVRGVAGMPPASQSRVVGGLPLGIFLGGITAAALISLILTLTYYSGTGIRLAVGFDVATVLADAVAVFGVWQAGVAGSAGPGLRALGLVIALLSPVLDVIGLVADAVNSYSPFYGLGRSVFLLLPVITVLAWLVTTGLPGRSYFSLFIAFGGGLLAGITGGFAVGIFGIVLSTAGIVVAVLVANSVGRRPARVTVTAARAGYAPASGAVGYSGSDAAYAAIARPETTNGFAVSALVFGLIGGTILPIVFGHVALAQIGRTGERGRGMAIAGLILGYLSLTIVIIIVIVAAVAAANSTGGE